MEAPVDLAKLSAWMDTQGLGSGPLDDVTPLSGGTQNILMRFVRDGRPYVLRRPPLHLRDNSNKTMRREARMLGALAGTDVPHPALIAACEDETVLGAVFYLMEPIEGFNPATGLKPLHAGSEAVRHRMGLALVEGIAALGALDYRERGLDGFGKPENYLTRQVSRWKGQLDSYAQFPDWSGPGQIPGIDEVGRWLEAHRPAQFMPGIIHGDYHLANVLYRNDSGELAAIVDWELTTIGDPLLDIGGLLSGWPDDDPDLTGIAIQPWTGFPTRAEMAAHYAARTARDMSALDWYVVLACYKIGIILEGTHARASAGQAPKETGDLLHSKTIALFEKALGLIR